MWQASQLKGHRRLYCSKPQKISVLIKPNATMGPKVQQKTKEQKMAAALAGSRSKKKVLSLLFTKIPKNLNKISINFIPTFSVSRSGTRERPGRKWMERFYLMKIPGTDFFRKCQRFVRNNFSDSTVVNVPFPNLILIVYDLKFRWSVLLRFR